MQAEEEREYKGYTIKIFQDEDYMNIREEDDHLFTMLCFHSRYNLGDTKKYAKEKGIVLTSQSFSSWDSLQSLIDKQERSDILFIRPLFLMDHSGLSMNIGGFNCNWDSGQVGFIFTTKKRVREWYGVKKITDDLLKKVETHMHTEVEEYSNYLGGFVYGYTVHKNDEDEEEIDSCWGFITKDFEVLFSQACANIDACLKKDRKIPATRWTKLNLE